MAIRLLSHKQLSERTGVPYNTLKHYASQNHPAYIKQVKKWNEDKWDKWANGLLKWNRNKRHLKVVQKMDEAIEQLV